MSAAEYCFLEPLDVLFLRGNRLFGDPGSFGESLVPPWPSVAAGALRSRMLADDDVDLSGFAAGAVNHPAIGTPAQPGLFTITVFHLARRHADGNVEILVAPPADLVIVAGENKRPATVGRSTPMVPADGIASSAPFAQIPVLAETERGKPTGGYWLSAAGWGKYLAGATPEPGDLVPTSQLWTIDPRVGVGLDAATRRASDGRLFSVQAVAMSKRGVQYPFDVGFLAGVRGAEPPRHGFVRLGGDGRAAAVHCLAAVDLPEPDYGAIADAGRCRLVLTSPGVFPHGWCLPGMEGDGSVRFAGLTGRVVCAAVPRAEVVSGWDLANGRPKAAYRAAPAGSVYWLDQLDTTAEQLRKLVDRGLWDDPCNDPQRRAEGFNRFMLAIWS